PKRKGFIGARPGKPRLPWSWRHWNGSRGSTTNACSNPSATFRPLRPKRDTIGNLQRRLWNLFYFNQKASAIPGAIQMLSVEGWVLASTSGGHHLWSTLCSPAQAVSAKETPVIISPRIKQVE